MTIKAQRDQVHPDQTPSVPCEIPKPILGNAINMDNHMTIKLHQINGDQPQTGACTPYEFLGAPHTPLLEPQPPKPGALSAKLGLEAADAERSLGVVERLTAADACAGRVPIGTAPAAGVLTGLPP